MSTQVLQEPCVNLRKVDPSVPLEEGRRLIGDYMSWEIVVNPSGAILQALEVQER